MVRHNPVYVLMSFWASPLQLPCYLHGFTEGLGYHDSLDHLSKCRTAATAVQVSDYKPKRQ